MDLNSGHVEKIPYMHIHHEMFIYPRGSTCLCIYCIMRQKRITKWYIELYIYVHNVCIFTVSLGVQIFNPLKYCVSKIITKLNCRATTFVV